jgi:predicted DsbA family dithiol-disulfide isomerase
MILPALKLFIVSALVFTFVLTPSIVHSQTTPETVAIVNGRKVTQADIDSTLLPSFLTIEPAKLYALRKVAIENFIIKIRLEQEAKRLGISVSALRKRMTIGKVNIPDNQVEDEYAKNAKHFGSMSPDEAKERIRLDLENEVKMRLYRRALSSLLSRSKVEVLLTPSMKLPRIDTALYPAKGPKEAKVTIVEYSDFRCPYCRLSQGTLTKLLAEYKDDVKLIYRNLPLRTDSEGLAPSIGAYCANSQGTFWEFHDRLFRTNDLSVISIKKIANDTGLDAAKFNACFSSDAARSAVLSDLKEANQLGITATPTLIINGNIHTGNPEYDDLKSIIDRELTSPATRPAN